MRLKEAILAKGEKAHDFASTCFGIDFRGNCKNYLKVYTKEQLVYLFENNLLDVYVPCGASWETEGVTYWEFTKRGIFFRTWYTTPFWTYVSIYVLHLWWFRAVWQRFMIKVFHKHYAWQEYEGVSNLDEI